MPDTVLASLKTAYEIQDVSPMVFNAAGSAVMNQTPTTREIYIQNRSLLSDFNFNLHLGSPNENVSLEPSSGYLPRADNQPVILSVKASPSNDFQKSSEMQIYIRIRNNDGFSSDR